MCALLTSAGDAHAHGRSLSYSSWELEGRAAEVRVRISRLEATRLGALGLASTTGREVSDYLSGRLRMASASGPCTLSSPALPATAAEGWSAHAWTVACPSSDGLRIESELMLEVAPSHLHFARVRRSDGEFLERVLFEAEPVWSLDPTEGGEASGTGLLGYLHLGVEHIATGWDHLAFVFALLLLAGSLREVAGLVTGFTVAHSLTLALAVLGIVRPEAAAVEAVIAFSVALVAAENGWLLAGRDRRVPWAVGAVLAGTGLLAAFGFAALPVGTVVGLLLFSLCHFGLLQRARRPGRLRAALAFAFGLIHGFGFAGVLSEMSLPPDRLVPALLGFNLGVEAGQLVVVACLWPMLSLLARAGDGNWSLRVAHWGSAAICGVGTYWFVVRAFG